MTDAVQTQFSGLVLGSPDPDRLAEWYRTAFAPDGQAGDILGRTVIVVGGARLVFDKRDDLAGRAAEPGRWLPNLFVDDVKAVQAHLDGMGVAWIRPVEEVPGFGFIGTLEDPDGNYFQVLQRAAA